MSQAQYELLNEFSFSIEYFPFILLLRCICSFIHSFIHLSLDLSNKSGGNLRPLLSFEDGISLKEAAYLPLCGGAGSGRGRAAYGVYEC